MRSGRECCLGESISGRLRTPAHEGPGARIAAAPTARRASLAFVLGLLMAGRPLAAPTLAASNEPAQRSPGAVLVVGPGQAYADLAAALAAAKDGDTVRVKGGVHRGPFVVARALALVGEGWPTLDGGGTGTVVTLQAPGSRLEGFTVQGSGARNDKEDAAVRAEGQAVIRGNRLADILYGIEVEKGPRSVVEDNVIVGRDLPVARRGDAIRLWESHDSRVAANRVSRGRDVVIWYSQRVAVVDNTVRQSRYGLHFMYSSGSQVLGNRFEDNAVGAYAMYSSDLAYRHNTFVGNHGPSGYGIALKDSDNVAIVGNVIAGNRTGLYFDNSPARPGAVNPIHDNLIAYNDIGLAFLPSVKHNAVGGNAFIENFQQVAVLAGGDFGGNDFTPGGKGNFWSNYAGFDADGDGRGDLPFQEVSLFDDLVLREPALRLFVLSPAQVALDFSARAFPVFRPAPIVTDTAPRMSPPPPPLALAAPRATSLGPAGALLVALALAVVAWGLALDRPLRTPRLAP